MESLPHQFGLGLRFGLLKSIRARKGKLCLVGSLGLFYSNGGCHVFHTPKINWHSLRGAKGGCKVISFLRMGGNQHANKKHKRVESLEGVLERITFYNEENGFLIGKLKGESKAADIAVVQGKPRKLNVA